MKITKIGWVYWGASLGVLGLTMIGLGIYREILRDLPNVNQIYLPPRMSSKILDKEDKLLYKFYKDENRSWVPLEKIPPALIWATLSIEDKNFYHHGGISIKGVLKAIIYNLRQSEDHNLRGGSTITQQLVKNVFLTREKTWRRKIKEAVLALLLEHKLSKDEILERYFNQVPYGGETYGAEEAAMRYFGKHVWEIGLNEAAFLAGLTAAPGSYSPFGNQPYLAYLRQKHVIDEMVVAGYINKDSADKLKKESIEMARDRITISAPHFVFYVREILETKYGFENFATQGLTVKTSLDLTIQEEAEKIVAEEMAKIVGLRIGNGAMEVVEVKDGSILAMVGSKNYDAQDIDGKFNVTTALRQPGSSIKPINYLLAIQNGRALSSMIDDSPVTYQIKGQKPYSPNNYNGKYMGNVTLRTALGSSLNIPSVRLLAENGVDKMIDLAEKMGISSWQERDRFGLSLALGAGEVRMVDLVQAYSVLANLGEKMEISPIQEVTNYLGEVIFVKDKEKQRVVEARHAYLINDVLSDNQARTPIFGSQSKLVIPGKTVAVKTGTTNSLKDNWCIGWTPSYLVAVWVGNNDSKPMSWVASGVTGATPIWNRMMSKMLEDKEDERWMIPLGVYQASVCGRTEYFTDGSERSVKCLPTGTTEKVEF